MPSILMLTWDTQEMGFVLDVTLELLDPVSAVYLQAVNLGENRLPMHALSDGG